MALFDVERSLRIATVYVAVGKAAFAIKRRFPRAQGE